MVETRAGHVPVMLARIVEGLEPSLAQGGTYVDCTLGLAGHFLQLPAGNPHGAARFGAYLAVVTLGADQLDLLARGQGADDAIAIGGATTDIGGQAVADPTGIAFLGHGGAGQGSEGGGQAEAEMR